MIANCDDVCRLVDTAWLPEHSNKANDYNWLEMHATASNNIQVSVKKLMYFLPVKTNTAHTEIEILLFLYIFYFIQCYSNNFH